MTGHTLLYILNLSCTKEITQMEVKVWPKEKLSGQYCPDAPSLTVALIELQISGTTFNFLLLYVLKAWGKIHFSKKSNF